MPTLYDKLWATHVVADAGDGAALLYIDLMLLHEVSSPQAFAGLRSAGRVPHRIAPHLAVADHAVPTYDRDRPLADCHARAQVSLLEDNCKNRIAYLLSPTPGRGSSASSSAVVTLAKLSNRA